ncbi:MAG: metallopeptidase family protein [Peptoniphilus sp.]|nr:metallopeptidase family protein [Peptoniphilus sp.]
MNRDRLDEFQRIVEKIYDEFDERFFVHLNGGVVIEEDVCYHPEVRDGDLLVLGAYRRDLIGRSIILYYGSFMEMYGYLTEEELEREIRKTFEHELTHHLEFLARENDLEVEDLKYIRRYKEK